ncbi:MAG TPA: hypothetical protein VFQ69_05710 [Rhizomicrobium sp.]|nr:hypothetical protein [Rhizomicrobium sp.]
MVADEAWIRVDEAEDVAASVRHVLHSLALTTKDQQAWKWVLLALHSALQGACVCHLTTTASPVGALTEKNTVEWLVYFEASRTDSNVSAPKTYLLNFPDLLKAIRKPKSAGDGSDLSAVQISDSELEWLKRFHSRIRNQFIRFEPTGWSIEVSGIPAMTKLAARIIKDILDIGWAFRHKDKAWRDELQANLVRLSSDGY